LGKKKLSRFRELESLDRVIQPPFEEVFGKDYYLKGKWCQEVFGNDKALVLELGCGKGEYTVGLARNYPDKNYMGLDIKGARIWTGAKVAHEEGLSNVAFLRTRIDFVNSFFAKDEIDEIWITFPDPQEKKRRQGSSENRQPATASGYPGATAF
jgi:tRNA (guanine-N7-)-methyltransferase